MAVSGSDDGTVKTWDPRSRGAASSMNNKFQVTAVAYSSDGTTVYSGGIDADIKGWDLRMGEVCSTFKSHSNTITGLAINNAGTHLLSNGMDHCLRIWDIRPYPPPPPTSKPLFRFTPHALLQIHPGQPHDASAGRR